MTNHGASFQFESHCFLFQEYSRGWGRCTGVKLRHLVCFIFHKYFELNLTDLKCFTELLHPPNFECFLE